MSKAPTVYAAPADDPRWEQARNGDAWARESLIEDHVPLLTQVANIVHRKLPSHVERDEILSLGTFGLIQAVDTYNPKRASFRTHAAFLIKARIYDELRALDWAPRSVRKKIKDVKVAQTTLLNAGLRGTDEEVARELGQSVVQVRSALAEEETTYPTSLHDFDYTGEIGNEGERLPSAAVNLEQDSLVGNFLGAFAAWIETLETDAQQVWALRFYCGYTVQETALLMSISPQAVNKTSQLVLSRFRTFVDELTRDAGVA